MKASCLAHYTFEKSERKLLLLDIQGNDYMLFDPEIATSEEAITEGGQLKFCMGNMSQTAVNMFRSLHDCNRYCEIIELKQFSRKSGERCSE